MCGSEVTVLAAFKTANIDPISLSPTIPPGFVDLALPQCFRHFPPTLWMLLQERGTMRPTLACPCPAQIHLSQVTVPLFVSGKVLLCSVVRSTYQRLGTPYQSGGNITDIGCSENSFGYAVRDTCPIGSTEPVVGLGLHVPEPPKPSPLRLSSEQVPEMLNGFGTIPFSVEHLQGPQNNDTRWQDLDTGFSRAGSYYNGVFTPTPHPHQTSRTRSTSNRGAGTSISPLLFLPEAGSLGDNCTNNVRSTARSFSQPPGNYALPSQESWGKDSHSYAVANFPARGSQWTSDYKPVSPIQNKSEESPLFQSRVGSDRTRAISRSRRSNPDKKLLHCPVPGCGATLTSRHNFKSTPASSIPRS
jgi:hypothetical protein